MWAAERVNTPCALATMKMFNNKNKIQQLQSTTHQLNYYNTFKLLNSNAQSCWWQLLLACNSPNKVAGCRRWLASLGTCYCCCCCGTFSLTSFNTCISHLFFWCLCPLLLQCGCRWYHPQRKSSRLIQFNTLYCCCCLPQLQQQTVILSANMYYMLVTHSCHLVQYGEHGWILVTPTSVEAVIIPTVLSEFSKRLREYFQ